MVGVVAVGIALLIGTPIGILAAVFAQYPWGQWLGALIMRANDILLAFPALLLAIIFAAVYQPGTGPAMVAVGIASIPGFARVARSGTMQVLGSEYVRAARAANRGTAAIAVVHVLPNIAGMVIVQASVTFAISVLAEAGLSPRPRHPGAGALVGADAPGVPAVPRHPSRTRAVAGPGHRGGRPRLQPPRRRTPRPLRPEDGGALR